MTPLMRIEGDALVLEMKSHEIRIALAGVKSAVVEKGWVTKHLVLTGRTAAALEPLKQEKLGRAEIAIDRGDVDAVRILCTQITTFIREFERAEVDKELDGMNLSLKERELLK